MPQVAQRTLKELAFLGWMYRTRIVLIPYEKDKSGGYCDYVSNKIFITVRSGRSLKTYLRIFFHELGHIYCWENGKYPAYHTGKKVKDLNRREILALRRTGLRAERYVDKWARRQLYHYCGGITWHAYSGKEGRDFLHKNFLDKYYKLK